MLIKLEKSYWIQDGAHYLVYVLGDFPIVHREFEKMENFGISRKPVL